jgi:hypothetical protein
MGALQIIVAFVVAGLVTALELITTKYPRTSGFVLQIKWFYAYVLIYGVLGAIAYSLLPLLAGEVALTGIGLSNAVVGFSIKAFLHIRIFTVSTGPGQPTRPCRAGDDCPDFRAMDTQKPGSCALAASRRLRYSSRSEIRNRCGRSGQSDCESPAKFVCG